MITEANEPIKDPEIRPQKELYCWQKATQLAFPFPSRAKWTMAAAEEAPPLTTLNIIVSKTTKIIFVFLAAAWVMWMIDKSRESTR